MKTIKFAGNEIKVTKKDIEKYMSLERPVSYYSRLDGNIIAQSVAISEVFFGWDGLETKQYRIDDVYNRIDELIDSIVDEKAKEIIASYEERHSLEEYIEDVYTTTAGDLKKLEHWDFSGYDDDDEIKIFITNMDGKLTSTWADSFDRQDLNIEEAVKAIYILELEAK